VGFGLLSGKKGVFLEFFRVFGGFFSLFRGPSRKFSGGFLFFLETWALPVASCLCRAYTMPTHYNNYKVKVYCHVLVIHLSIVNLCDVIVPDCFVLFSLVL